MQENISGKKTLGITLLAATLAAIIVSGPTIYGLLTSSARIGSTGTLKTVGVKVYSDSACTNEVSSIDWGTLELGSTKDATVYVKNTGSVAVTLSLSTENWNPSSASGYITLTWNYGGQSLSPGSNIQVKLTLTVSANATGVTSFSFNILITGSG